MQTYPSWLAATLASDATEGQGIIPSTILSSLRSAACVVGPAAVIEVSHNDNLAIKQILESPPAPGCVLVAAGASTSTTAIIGGLMARELQIDGVAGLITDGLVRDSAEIREMGFGVWCRGVTPAASQKNGPAHIGGNILLGGVAVRDGDLVIADDDGVVIWPQERISELLVKAEAKLQYDHERLERLLRLPSKSPQP